MSTVSRGCGILWAACFGSWLAGIAAASAQEADPPAASVAPAAKEWRSLFDGEDLGLWKSTKFGGEGEVHIDNGAIILEMGASLTGITYTGELPKTNYEIRLEAQRVDGFDFFCGLTFPVEESHCSFIVGGWGGGVVGLSSIDGEDAARNETTTYMRFEKGKWYPVRVQVTPTRIQCWLSEKLVVDQDLRDRKISVRSEVLPSRPLGISAWETKAALRKIELRQLPAAGTPAAGND